jgi:fibronectin type 3 domain-containing protein
LTWSPSSTAGVAGYRVYYGLASNSYQQSAGNGVNIGNATNYVVTGLQSKKVYYFAVTSVDAAGVESIFSNEVSKLTP